MRTIMQVDIRAHDKCSSFLSGYGVDCIDVRWTYRSCTVWLFRVQGESDLNSCPKPS